MILDTQLFDQKQVVSNFFPLIQKGDFTSSLAFKIYSN